MISNKIEHEKNKNMVEGKKRSRKGKKPYNSICHTTGDIELNISHFNNRMGTGDLSTADGDGADSSGVGLAESKRYVRRYYVRPQNIFCSNKNEILKTLIDIGDANCTIYTLNNLGDEKDVTKLMNSDIIYYYDEGILYDKNHVRIFDYDLGVKREEDRKKLGTVDDDSKEFRDTYSDRMTSATELEEAFNLSFDSYNAFGENLTEAKIDDNCCICGELLDGYGNNPEPYMDAEKGRCCDGCNLKFVIPARLAARTED